MGSKSRDKNHQTWGPPYSRALQYGQLVLINIFRFWTAQDSYEQVDYRVKKFLYLFACTNSCANPLIYGVFREGSRMTPSEREWGNNWGWLRTKDTKHFKF